MTTDAASKISEYSIKFSATQQEIDDFISTIFESGIGYWARVSHCDGGWKILEYGDESTIIKTHHFSEKKLLEGFAVCASKYPKHFANWISRNYDAITADVVAQCAIFGEIKYGDE